MANSPILKQICGRCNLKPCSTVKIGDLTCKTHLNDFGKNSITVEEAAEIERALLVRAQQAAQKRLCARAHGISQKFRISQNSGHETPVELPPSFQFEPPASPVV